MGNAIFHSVLAKTCAMSYLSRAPLSLSFFSFFFLFFSFPIATGLAGMPFDVAYVMESYGSPERCQLKLARGKKLR